MRPTVSRVKKVLSYDPISGIFVWLLPPNRGKSRVGLRAGTLNNHDGYRRITIDSSRHPEQHLAWVFMTGQWPTEVDHKNRMRSDNRWENLREATRSNNACNKLSRASVSNFKGVTPHGPSWAAKIQVNKKRFYLGTYPTPEEAKALGMTPNIDTHN